MSSIEKRLDAVTQIPKAYLREDPPAPISLKIELTARCNYRCLYCSLVQREDQRGDMDDFLFRKICSDAVAHGVTEVGPFLIGEPFSSKIQLVHAIDYLKRILLVPYVFLTSNASMADPDTVHACMSNGLDSLKWSCNFATKDQLQDMARVPGRMWNRSLRNIKSAHNIRERKRLPTRLYASSIKYTDDQVELMYPILQRFILPYVDSHYWLPLYSMGGLARNSEDKAGLVPVPGNPGRCDSPVPPIPCWTVFTAAHVLSDGRMTACCADGVGRWVVGDLNKMSFMQAWHSQEFRSLRRAHLSGDVTGTKCERCALLPGGAA